MQVREVGKPSPRPGEVCIRVHATAVTSSDCYVHGLSRFGDPNELRDHNA